MQFASMNFRRNAFVYSLVNSCRCIRMKLWQYLLQVTAKRWYMSTTTELTVWYHSPCYPLLEQYCSYWVCIHTPWLLLWVSCQHGSSVSSSG
jgi:hypothetical protein